MSKQGFTYIASPYSDPDSAIRLQRFIWVMEFTASKLKSGEFVYSPIVHCHNMAEIYDIPTGFEFWKNYNEAMILSAKGLLVYAIPGWRTSIGVTAEIAVAKRNSLPILYVPDHEGEGLGL